MTETCKPSPHEVIKVDEDLELRALSEADANRLFQLTDENRAYLAKYLPWVDKTTSTDDSLSFIKATKEKRTLGQEYGFGIIVNGEIMGHISLMHITDGQIPEIGYWIAESVSGRGTTKKAAKAVTEFGFNTLNLGKILIRAREDNVASNKIAESLGYAFDGLHDGDDGLPHNHWVKAKDTN